MSTRLVTHQTVEAVITPDGQVTLLFPVQLEGKRRALVTILNERPADSPPLDERPADVPTRTRDDAPAEVDSPLAGLSPPVPPRYRIIRRLSSGGMGTTFQAEDTRTGHRVCLKQLHRTIDKGSLLQECKSLARLDHPNIAGQRPFQGKYTFDIIYALLNEDPKPVTVLRPDVPEALEQIVEKLLRKDPSERYQQAEEVLRLLGS